MSAFTDRLYRQWRQAHGGSGYGFEDRLALTARPGRSPSPRKAKAQRANAGPSVHKPTDKESNHGISQV